MKQHGIEKLQKNDQAAMNDFFDQLQQYGLFIVRRGELEAWLPELKIASKKSAWTVDMLERMGSDPNDGSYVKPTAGDVWDFIRNIVDWIRDPRRKGTD